MSTSLKLVVKESIKSKKYIDPQELQSSAEFKSLAVFFEVEKNFQLAETILKKKKRISLRVVEHVAANSHKFFYNPDIHGVFRDKLDALGKRHFDIFRRSSRFDICLGSRRITTNLSQMRFFRFAIGAGVIEWLLADEANVKKAEAEMAAELVLKKAQPKGSRKKRKRELRAVGCNSVTFRF